MRPNFKRPSAPMIVSVAALVVALGGTSYAAGKIDSGQIKKNAVTSTKIDNGTIRGIDLSQGLRNAIVEPGPAGPAGADGAAGPAGPAGPAGVDATARWALVEADGTISSQSGGFTIVAAYPTLANTAVAPAPDNSLRANGNVYIDSGEDLSDNGIVASIALQNTSPVNPGRAAGADANPTFSGEISVSRCNFAANVAPAPAIPTNCAPAGAQNATSFVVSPRNSDGSFTTDGARKRFYVIITG